MAFLKLGVKGGSGIRGSWYVGCPVVESWRVKKINVAICDDLEPWKLFSDKFWLLYLHSELL